MFTILKQKGRRRLNTTYRKLALHTTEKISQKYTTYIFSRLSPDHVIVSVTFQNVSWTDSPKI